MKSNFKFYLVLIYLFISTTLLFSQAGRGRARIYGTVKDENGKPLDGIKITAVHVQYKTIYEAKTNQKGEWSIIGLGSGNWRITAKSKDFIPATYEQNVKQLSENPAINFVLEKLKIEAERYVENEEYLLFLEEGNKLYEEEKFDDALYFFKQFLEKSPKFYQIHINIGNCYKEKGEFEKAIGEYNKAIEATKEGSENLSGNEITANAYAGIGEVHLRQNDLEEAQKYLTEAIKIYPNNENISYMIGEIYFSNGKIDEAVEYLTKAIQINPASSKSFLKLGYVYLNKADYSRSIESFMKYLELEHPSPKTEIIKNLINQIEKLKKK